MLCCWWWWWWALRVMLLTPHPPGSGSGKVSALTYPIRTDETCPKIKRGKKNKVANCPSCHREINTCSKTAASSRKRCRVNIHRNTEAEVLKSRHSGVKGLDAEGDDDLSSRFNQRLCKGPSRSPTHRLHLPVVPVRVGECVVPSHGDSNGSLSRPPLTPSSPQDSRDVPACRGNEAQTRGGRVSIIRRRSRAAHPPSEDDTEVAVVSGKDLTQ